MKDIQTQFNQHVKFKYQNSRYFHELVIFYHLDELVMKKNDIITKDSKPFQHFEFNKEIADLKILLDMLAEFDEDFNKLVEKRKERFLHHTLIEKGLKEEE